MKWVVPPLGLLSSGAELVLVDARFKGDKAADVLVESRATQTFLCGPIVGIDYHAMLADKLADLSHLATVVTMDEAGLASFEDGSSADEVENSIKAKSGDDVSDAVFTSAPPAFQARLVDTRRV